MTSLEYLKWGYSSIYIIYDGNKKIGYTTSMKEADAICEKKLNLQWDLQRDISKNINVINSLIQYYK